MRTARLLPVSPTMHCSGEGGYLLPGTGVYPSMHWGRHPPVNRMTDRQVYKYNLRKLRLQTVKITVKFTFFADASWRCCIVTSAMTYLHSESDNNSNTDTDDSQYIDVAVVIGECE